MSDVDVAAADLDDGAHAEAVVALIDDYARDPMGRGRALEPEVRARLIPVLKAHPASRVFLAFVDGRAVGVAVCFVGLSTFAARPIFNVHDLGVVADARGRGIGRALLERARAEAERLGCCKLTLEVRTDNARARHLYASLGFRQAEAVAGVDMRLWEKPLRQD